MTAFVLGIVWYFSQYLTKAEIQLVSKVAGNLLLLSIIVAFIVGADVANFAVSGVEAHTFGTLMHGAAERLHGVFTDKTLQRAAVQRFSVNMEIFAAGSVAG